MDSFTNEQEPWFLFDDDFAFRQRKPDAPADKHLSSPISPSLLYRMKDIFEDVIQADYNGRGRKNKMPFPYLSDQFEIYLKRLRTSSDKYTYSGIERVITPLLTDFKGMSTFPYIVEPTKYAEMFQYSTGNPADLEKSLEQGKHLFDIEMDAFSSWGDSDEVRRMAKHHKDQPIALAKDTYKHYLSYLYWDTIVETYRVRKSQARYGRGQHTINGHVWYYYDGYAVLQTEKKITTKTEGKTNISNTPNRYIMTYNQLQMFQDTCLARFNAYLSIDCGIQNASKEIRHYLTEIILWQEKTLTTYGNAGYDLVKGPESLTKAYLNQLSGGDILPISSFIRTLAKMITKEKKIQEKQTKTKGMRLSNELADILSSTKDISIIAELFGCTKLSGHPLVFAEISAKSVREEAQPSGTADHIAIEQYRLQFIQLILHRYLEKNGHWPIFKEGHAPQLGTKLYRIWKADIKKVRPGSYPMKDLTDLRFDKFMDFDYSPDYLDMIDDKAISPGGKHAAEFWFRQQEGTHRRLLENLISRKDVDTYAIVERMRRGNFRIEERIVELTQKEREFKVAARCFAKLTFEVRLFFVLTEANLKRFCGGDAGDNGYMPQQTMTMSHAKLKQRLYSLSTRKNTSKSCMIEVDFSRWNLRWREWTVDPIARILEDIFGLLGVFSQAHSFFYSSTIVLTDKHNKPAGITEGLPAHKWPESELVWRRHRGGFEGIQQTLWTMCTIAMMYYALRDEKCSFKMAGQGDNQIFHINFLDSARTLSQSLLKLLYSLDRECTRLNHEVKPEECIDSKTVLTYGKEIYIKGVHTLYSMKFSSRAFARSDYSIPSLTKEIAGIVSNSVAVAGTLYQPIRAILWKHIQVLLYLYQRKRNLFFKAESEAISRLLKSPTSRKALLIPGSLGGLPMMPWTRYFSKGETDDLSFDVAGMYYIAEHEPLINNYMTLLLQKEFISRKIDVSNLINDPHSIPIDRPNDASHLVSDAVANSLPERVENHDIKQLVDPSYKYISSKYKECLTEIQPVYPKILHDIYELTPGGMIDKMIKRFSMTRTLERFIDMKQFFNTVSKSNGLLIHTIIDRLVSSGKAKTRGIPPPYEICNKLRDMWGISLKHSSIGIYTPFDLKLSLRPETKEKIEVTVPSGSEILTTYGTSPPNFGTNTRQKISDHGYRIVNTNSTVAALKRATLMFSELQGSATVKPFFDSIIRTRSPWDLDSLVPIFPTQYGGTSVHRHQSATSSFAMLGSNTVATHCILNTDMSGVLSGGELDYPVVFQTLFMTAMNLIQNFHAIKIPVNRISFLVPADLDPIDSSTCEFSQNLSLPTWPQLKGNKLAWVGRLMASEVPVVPRSDFIDHIGIVTDDISLLYSYLEFNHPDPELVANPYDGILQPKDFIDLKECTRLTGTDVEIALSWVLLSDVLEAYVNSQGNRFGSQSINSYIQRRAKFWAGLWIRVRLHPQFRDTPYNLKNRIKLQPTEGGYKKPVDYMAFLLRNRIQERLEIKNFSSIPDLVLFNNWKSLARRISMRRLLLAGGLASFSSINKQELRSFVSRMTPPHDLLESDPSTYLSAISKPFSRNIRGFNHDLPILRTKYTQSSSTESLRRLRERISEVTSGRELLPDRLNVKIINHGICRYVIDDSVGNVLPDVRSAPFSLPQSVRYNVLKRRVVGESTPLFSDWNFVLQQIFDRKMIITGSICRVIGIGRGAICRSLLNLNMKVIGYDLQKTFPTLSHRSGSYVPPEILSCRNINDFSWSDHTMSSSGDCEFGDLQILETDTCILDIDQSYSKILKILDRLPLGIKTIIRFRGTPQEIDYMISVLRPDLTWNLVLLDDHPIDIIMYCERLPPIAEGNATSIIWKKKNEIKYLYSERELYSQIWECDTKIAEFFNVVLEESNSHVKANLQSLLRTPFNDLTGTMEKIIYRLLNDSIELLSGKELRARAILDNILELEIEENRNEIEE